METDDADHHTPAQRQPQCIPVSLSFQGQTVVLDGGIITTETTGAQLYEQTLHALGLSAETSLKILAKGKRIDNDTSTTPMAAFLSKTTARTKPLKLLVMATSPVVLADMALKRSDPTIRGFDDELKPKVAVYQPWGPILSQQDKNYKFCRFEACTWQSFGHRPTDGTTPHAFQAMQLLEKLATDPGVVAVMVERELVVGTLGEMDPIDDRVMQKKQSENAGVCLLGYNTNAGARIDLKLRTDDLKGFRPYPELVSTLLHELSHNWVGEHNALFWTNFAQMRAEYLTRHKSLQSTVIEGSTTAERAGLVLQKGVLQHIPETILKELLPDMGQHGLHPRMIEAPIRQRCQELEQEFFQGQTLGRGGVDTTTTSSSSSPTMAVMSARERALAAAEQRRKQQEQEQEKKQGGDHEKS